MRAGELRKVAAVREREHGLLAIQSPGETASATGLPWRADPRPLHVERLTRTLDEVRREWIAADRADWIGRNAPYCELEALRGLVGEPARAVLVTAKEDEFARLILDVWRVTLAEIQGKEAGTHKCDNLRALIAAYTRTHGRRPRVRLLELDQFKTGLGTWPSARAASA